MNWTGKMVGGAVGLAVAGPVGLALGTVLGHFYDNGLQAARVHASRRDGFDSGHDAAAIAACFFATTFEVMGHVAKADGRVSEDEIKAARGVMREFRLDRMQVASAIQHFTIGKGARFDLGRALQRLQSVCIDRPDLLRVFLEIQMRAAIAGTDLQGASRASLTQIGARLGVGALELAHMETVLRLRQGSYAGARNGSRRERTQGGYQAARARQMGLDEAYQILEIPASSSDSDVVKAYRRQLSRHHPDKLKANGLPESMLEHAKQRTQQVIEAHERIRVARGLA